MVSVKRELLLGISIPIIFTIAVVAFFTLIPSETQTLTNFIGYTSSLATILMVLVVIVTTSLQLKEMQSSKLLQTQPFPAITPLKESHIEELSFFYDYPASKTILGRRLFFLFDVESIGNAPIIAVDIIPKLRYVDEKGKPVVVECVWERIDSLKPNEKKQMDVMFAPKTGDEMADCIMRRFLYGEVPCGGHSSSSQIQFVVLYKNLLGASFRLRMLFDVFLYEEDTEKIKSCLKLSETARIDYAKEMKTIDSLMKSDEQKANEILEQISNELSKKDGCERIDFEAVSRHGVFSVNPISEKEYQKQIQAQQYGTTVAVQRSDQDAGHNIKAEGESSGAE